MKEVLVKYGFYEVFLYMIGQGILNGYFNYYFFMMLNLELGKLNSFKRKRNLGILKYLIEKISN